MNRFVSRLHRSYDENKLAWYWMPVIVTLTALLRWHGFPAPLHTDICVYVCVGQGMLDGGKLYIELLDNKPPGIYLLFMLLIKLAGQSPLVFNSAGLVAVLVTQVLIYSILKRMASTVVALVGASFWGVASLSIPVLANQPHTEVFINAFLVLAVWGVIVRLQGKRYALGWSGFGIGVASLIKTNVLFVYIALLVFWGIYAWRQYRNGRGVVWFDWFAWVLPPVIVWGTVGIYFMANHALPEFVDVVFKSLRAYAGNVLVNQVAFFTQWRKHLPVYKHLLLAGMIGSMTWAAWKCLRRRFSWQEAAVLFYGIGSVLMVAALQNLFAVYFVIWLPPTTLMTTLLVNEVRLRRTKWFVPTMVVLLVLAIAYGFDYLVKPPRKISKEQSVESLWADRKLGEYLKSITKPDDTLYQWGMSAQLNYFSGLKSPTGLIQKHLLDFSPDQVQFKIKSKVFDDLMKSPPDIIVFASWIGDFRSNMFYQALSPQYDYFGCFDKYLIYTRKGYAIDPRRHSVQYREIAEQPLNQLGTEQLRLAEETRRMFRQGTLIPKRITRDLIEVKEKNTFGRLMGEGNRFATESMWTEAMEKWAEAHERKRLRPEPFANLGIYHEYMGSYYLALHNYEVAYLQLGAPWDDYYRSAQHRMIAEIHRLEDSGPSVPKIKRDLITPDGEGEYEALVKKGIAEARQVRWEEAKTYWKQAQVISPERLEARANLGVYYEIHYQFEAAREIYLELEKENKEPWHSFVLQVEQLMEQLPEKADSAIPKDTLRERP